MTSNGKLPMSLAATGERIPYPGSAAIKNSYPEQDAHMPSSAKW